MSDINIEDISDFREIENEEYLVWQITIQRAGSGDTRRYIVTCGFETAYKLGEKIASESFGNWILVNVENLTMSNSAYFLHVAKHN